MRMLGFCVHGISSQSVVIINRGWSVVDSVQSHAWCVWAADQNSYRMTEMSLLTVLLCVSGVPAIQAMQLTVSEFKCTVLHSVC